MDARARDRLRQAIEREHAVRLTQLRQSLLGPRGIRLLDILGLGVAVLLGVWLVPAILSVIPSDAIRLPRGLSLDLKVYIPWLVMAACWALGLAFALRRDWLRAMKV